MTVVDPDSFVSRAPDSRFSETSARTTDLPSRGYLCLLHEIDRDIRSVRDRHPILFCGIRDLPSGLAQMNQQCKVCGEPAAGYHFGAFTCEGCKSFFGRTYNNIGNIAECKNGGGCVIDKKNRTTCKSCRLKKCLAVGMSKSGSRYGRRSNWFKIHCLLQEQTNQSISVTPNVPSPFTSNFLLSQSQSRKDITPPRREDLMQSQLITVASMFKQECDTNTSPHINDPTLYDRRCMLTWYKSRRSYPSRSPPRESMSPLTYDRQQASPIFSSMNVVNHREPARTLSDTEYAHMLQGAEKAGKRKRYFDTVSESGSVADGSSDGERLHDIESGSNSEHNSSKATIGSPSRSLAEQEATHGKTINATLRLTAAYQHGLGHHNLSLAYPPPGLVTPSPSQNAQTGGNVLLISPSPGGLAVEQIEPIDLSVRASRGSSQPTQTSSEDEYDEADEDKSVCDDSGSNEGTTPAARSTPLDLTLTVKRPAELPLTL